MCVSELAHKYDRNEVSIYIPSPCFYFEENGDFFLVETHTRTHIHTHPLLSLAFPLTLEISVPFRPTNCFFDRRPTFFPPSFPPTKFQQTRHYFPLDDLADKRNREYFSSELHGPRFAETSRSGGTRHRLGIINEVTRIIAIVIRYIGTCYTQEAVERREGGSGRRRRRRPASC